MAVWYFFPLFHVDYGNRLLFVARPKERWALGYIWNFSTLRGFHLVERKTFSWLRSESIHVDDDDVNVNGEKFSHHVNTLQRCSRVKLFDHSRECHLSWNLIVTFQTSLYAGARWWSELPPKKRRSHSHNPMRFQFFSSPSTYQLLETFTLLSHSRRMLLAHSRQSKQQCNSMK